MRIGVSYEWRAAECSSGCIAFGVMVDAQGIDSNGGTHENEDSKGGPFLFLRVSIGQPMLRQTP